MFFAKDISYKHLFKTAYRVGNTFELYAGFVKSRMSTSEIPVNSLHVLQLGNEPIVL